jgi:NAD(P)-dependent dehydrogenase (short-subunit alcohol dehydrogenase family)
MTERVILIVGASSGIGRAAAHALAACGDRLILSSRGKAALEDTAEECRARGAAHVSVVPFDVTDREAVQHSVAAVLAEAGRIDAVVHTAGVVAYGRFEEIPAEVFDAVMNINVHGAANVAREVLPTFRRQRHGSLILVGSVIGNIAAPTMTPYAVSKYAVRSLGRQLALENRDLPDLHVSVVSPGSVDTPIYQQAANYLGRPGRPPAPVSSAVTVAESIVETLDHPRDRVSVGPANPIMRLGFTALPKVFDTIVGPLFRLLASKPGTLPVTTGNVFEARDECESVSGGEGQGLADVLGRLKGR